jgi:hypothetical protein
LTTLATNFDLLLVLEPSGAEQTAEVFLKFAVNHSYPTNYVKAFADLEAQKEVYMRLGPAFQFEAGRYVKTTGLLQQEVFQYVKFDLKFPEPSQRYIKAAASMQDRHDMYIRCFAQFVIFADYIKVRAALSKQPVIGDVGDTPPPNKVGLLSRHYLSVTSVKKEV